MIFAAGLGTRMGHLVRDKPKPLIKVGETTLLDHALSFTEHPNIVTRVVNVHYKGQMIRDHLRDQRVKISDETPELLETGGGLRKALPLLDSEVALTMNTDALWLGTNPVEALFDRWDPNEMDALLLLSKKERSHGHPGKGDFHLDRKGRLTRGPGPIYSGAQLIKTSILEAMPDGPFSMNLCWDQFAKSNRLFGTIYDGEWCDVGTPDGLATAEKVMASHV